MSNNPELDKQVRKQMDVKQKGHFQNVSVFSVLPDL